MTEICTSTIFYKNRKKIADAIIKVVSDLWTWWPLTVRQVYYQLVAKLIIENRLSEYRKVSGVLVKLRETELIPWVAIEDRTRRTTDKRGFSNLSAFLAQQFDAFAHPHYYGRCYVQRQDNYVEMSTEKDALSSVIETACWGYCTRLNIVRGQVSASMIERMSERFIEASARGQKPILLHLGDLDPSGVAIPKAIKKNLYNRHDVDVEVWRVALNPDQVKKFEIPESPDAVKPKDPNIKTWLQEYGSGQAAVELDGLHPQTLQDITRDALKSVYNMSEFEKEMEAERKERETLKMIRMETADFLGGRFPEHFAGVGGAI